MVDMTGLINLDLGKMRSAASDWGWIASRLRQAGEGYTDAVTAPLKAGTHWSGEDATEATRTCGGIGLDIDAVAKEAQGVKDFLDDIVDGTGDGFRSLAELQRQAAELQQQAIGEGFSVNGDGEVAWVVMRAPGPLSPEEQRTEQERNGRAQQLGNQLKDVLRLATEVDGSLERGLKVLFGTEDTFRTENRDRVDRDDADMSDSWNEAQLGLVRGYLYTQGWGDAGDLLGHFLEGSGEPVEVDADRMLSDMPAFRHDVDTTLAEVKKQPDGTFTSSWQSSAPDITQGDKSLNWYYALNHFQYRLVGHKEGDHVTYQVEVEKRYDWGIPSEHRRDLDKGPLHFEQADLARLNMVGMAKDFDVKGRSTTQTAG
ncbi:hypothetical protein ACGH2B_29500 [Streptomyces sp. BBFR2]|uniref:hypothetical protein n=1 Tax=Streptomyces sp. BBFR2 TaxID=3372854 RepID=UPI0037D9FEA7